MLFSPLSLRSVFRGCDTGGNGDGVRGGARRALHDGPWIAVVAAAAAAAAAGPLCPRPPSRHLAAVSIGGRFTLDAPSILRSVTREFPTSVQRRIVFLLVRRTRSPLVDTVRRHNETVDENY